MLGGQKGEDTKLKRAETCPFLFNFEWNEKLFEQSEKLLEQSEKLSRDQHGLL